MPTHWDQEKYERVIKRIVSKESIARVSESEKLSVITIYSYIRRAMKEGLIEKERSITYTFKPKIYQ